MSLVMYAKSELARLDMDEYGMQEKMNNHIVHMVEEFAKEGHSGFSANYAIAVLRRLLQFKPLSALTGEDDEWIEVCVGKFQNKRCSAVFKDDTRYGGKPYYIDGKVFSSDGGETWFTNRDSCVVIEFPFTVPDKPERIYLGKKPTSNETEKRNRDTAIIDQIIDRLAEYENTGLEPKEVQLIANVLREVGETYNCHFNFIVKVLKEYADVGGEKEKRNAREWERMVDAYGTLEGWLCPCGFSSAGAWNYCPSCGSEMYGGEKHED